MRLPSGENVQSRASPLWAWISHTMRRCPRSQTRIRPLRSEQPSSFPSGEKRRQLTPVSTKPWHPFTRRGRENGLHAQPGYRPQTYDPVLAGGDGVTGGRKRGMIDRNRGAGQNANRAGSSGVRDSDTTVRTCRNH